MTEHNAGSPDPFGVEAVATGARAAAPLATGARVLERP